MADTTHFYIDGSWVAPVSPAIADVINPATEEPAGRIGLGSAADVDRAVAAARRAFPAFSATSREERLALFTRIVESFKARRADMAKAVTAEMGAPAWLAWEIQTASSIIYFEDAAAVLRDFEFDTLKGNTLLTHEAIGVCGLITPWNWPLNQIVTKLAPALAAGCSVVVKPAQLTPLTTALVAEIVRAELAARHLPTGVVNVVPSSSASRISRPLLADPRLRKLSFTGSTEVGASLLKQAADGILRTSMELGGNAPFLVFDDADLDAAVEGAVAAKMRNSGQTCVAANRFLVQEGVAEEFTARLTEAFGRLVVGPGDRPGTTVGPLIQQSAVDRVTEVVQQADDAGAQVRVGGMRPEGRGWFYLPTVLDGVTPDMRVVTEEVFGPVAPVLRFGSEDEGVDLANATPFGLVAYAYTRDVGRVMRLTERIDAGMLGVNRGMVSDASAPFGGVKRSGLGREGGEAGIEEYVDPMYVAL